MIVPSALALSKLRYEATKCDWTTAGAGQHPKIEKLHSDSSHWRETLFQTDHSGNWRPERACDDLQPAVAAISLSSAKSNPWLGARYWAPCCDLSSIVVDLKHSVVTNQNQSHFCFKNSINQPASLQRDQRAETKTDVYSEYFVFKFVKKVVKQ